MRILGARLYSRGRGAADRHRARTQFALATLNDNELTAADRDRELAILAAIPGVAAELAVDGEGLERTLVSVEGGAVRSFAITDSRVPDRLEPRVGVYRPCVRASDATTAQDIVHAFSEALVEGVQELGDDEIRLPFQLPERAALRVFAHVAPLWREPVVRVVVEVEGRRYDVEIETSTGVTCRGLFLTSADPAHAARFAKLAGIDNRESVTVLPIGAPRPAKASPFDPQRPFTTGSATKRSAAWHDATQFDLGSVGKIVPIDPASTIAAVRDPANRDHRFAALRGDMYRFLARRDLPAVHEVFLWALREEDDESAATVAYVGWRLDGLIARLPDELREAAARGDKRLVLRIRRLLADAGVSMP